MLWSLAACRTTRCASWRGWSLGCLPRRRPLALATRMPSRVRSRMRSASNSATMASTLNSRRSTGSFGSCSEPLRLSLTRRRVRSSTMSRASGSERASRSSLVTTSVSPSRQAASASRKPGRSRLIPVNPWSDVDAVGAHTESRQRLALRGHVLLVGRHSGVHDQGRRHEILLGLVPAAGATRDGPS
jgi:hypothetical protein